MLCPVAFFAQFEHLKALTPFDKLTASRASPKGRGRKKVPGRCDDGNHMTENGPYKSPESSGQSPGDDAPEQRPLKSRNFTAWLIFGVVAAAFAIVYELGNDRELGEKHPAVGRRLPYLDLKPLTGGGSATSLTDLQGHVTLLDFWGTWCGPCVEEVPHIATIAAKYRSNPDFLVLPVSCGPGGQEDFTEIAEQTEAFLRNNRIEMPTYKDPGAYTRHAVDMLAGFQGYPTTIVLDRRCVVRGMWLGYRGGDERQIEKLVGELLNEPK